MPPETTGAMATGSSPITLKKKKINLSRQHFTETPALQTEIWTNAATANNNLNSLACCATI